MIFVRQNNLNWPIFVNYPTNFVKIIVIIKLLNVKVIVFTIKNNKSKSIFLFKNGNSESFFKI